MKENSDAKKKPVYNKVNSENNLIGIKD